MKSSSRRQFLATTGAAIAATPLLAADKGAAHLACGVKVGEVTDTSAILWARLTAQPKRVSGVKVVGRPKKMETPPIPDTAKLDGACPGANGWIRVQYGIGTEMKDLQTTYWEMKAEDDFAHGFRLTNLKPDTDYSYIVTTAPTNGNENPHGSFQGGFRTAPGPSQSATINFAVITCQMYSDMDHANGFNIYPAIQKLKPHFVAVTGDNVYYDSEIPVATSPALARYHWERMYSLPRHIDLLRQTVSYWEKDDHDTVKNDCWPGQKAGDFTYEWGQRIFREQVPMGEKIYRTFRWGKHLQIWLTDGRDFRSPNNAADGPEKTIWGKEQKEWLFKTLKESDATWKVLISPTPLVGPDRGNKGDNHANAAFQHEGDEARAWFKANVPSNFFTMCGDRHWQYHSVHPKTGLNEFSVGPASDQHAQGSPGEDKTYHRFHRMLGGFVSVAVSEKSIAFKHHDVNGKVVYQKEFKA